MDIVIRNMREKFLDRCNIAILSEKSVNILSECLDYIETRDPRAIRILKLRYGKEPKTLKQVGCLVENRHKGKYGICAERVREIEAKCFRWLKKLYIKREIDLRHGGQWTS